MATALAIINKSLRVLGVIDKNQPLSASDRNYALEGLNYLTAWIATEYNHLWLEELYILLCKKGVASYSMGDGSKYIAKQDDLKELSLTADALAADTTITVSSASGVMNGYSIAVFDNDGNSFFTTVNGAPVGNVITLTDQLSANSNSGNLVYAFPNVAKRALRVRNAQFAVSTTSSEIPVNRMSRDTYFDQPIKLTQGSASNWYYDPQLSTGKLYLWPTPYSDKNVLRFTAQRPFVINEKNIDSVDFPGEWLLALSYLLAVSLTDEYMVDPNRQALIKAKSDEYFASALAFDNDGDSLAIEIQRY